ncbi:forkhead domain 3F [Carabus blaptoides fortunei]
MDLDELHSLKTEDFDCFLEQVYLVNGYWDTYTDSTAVPKIVAEMHNVKLEELQHTWITEAGDTFFVNTVLDTHTDPLKLKAEVFTAAPSPGGSDSGFGNDSPEGNLSWLLNFKLDEIPGLPDYATQTKTKRYTPRKLSENRVSTVFINDTPTDEYFIQEHINVTRVNQEQPVLIPKEETRDAPGKALRQSGTRKPPFTYTELIEHALREKGELTVSGIYQWISDHFSFYKANDDRWKNSVRHNLSINPHFRKGGKALHGAGHLWTIAEKNDMRNNSSWNIKRQRMQQFMQTAANDWQQQQDMELAAATASIIPDRDRYHQVNGNDHQEHGHQTRSDILDGMKQRVEVQYIIPVNEAMDFMCPVSKEQVAQECGLDTQQITDNDYLITDLNPNTLGLSLAEAEIITTEQLFPDDLNFQCYEQ